MSCSLRVGQRRHDVDRSVLRPRVRIGSRRRLRAARLRRCAVRHRRRGRRVARRQPSRLDVSDAEDHLRHVA